MLESLVQESKETAKALCKLLLEQQPFAMGYQGLLMSCFDWATRLPVVTLVPEIMVS